MKKYIYILFAVVGILVSGFTFAKNADVPSVTSQQLPAGASTASCDFYPTCITVTNYSSDYITVSVPVLGFSTLLYPMYVQAIQSLDNNSKLVRLYDWLGIMFYEAVLPNHYDLYVYDLNGKKTVKFNKI